MITRLEIVAGECPGGLRWRRWKMKAPKGRGFSEEGVERLLHDFVQQFDAANPNNQYRLVELQQVGRTKTFKLVWDENESGSETSAGDVGESGVAG